jgi:hypothetical protein
LCFLVGFRSKLDNFVVFCPCSCALGNALIIMVFVPLTKSLWDKYLHRASTTLAHMSLVYVLVLGPLLMYIIRFQPCTPQTLKTTQKLATFYWSIMINNIHINVWKAIHSYLWRSLHIIFKYSKEILI